MTEQFTLVSARPADLVSIREYLGKNPEFIADLRLVWNSKKQRSDNSWEAIAIKFSEVNFTQDDLIRAIVKMKADDYLGMQDGYHVFWWD